MQKKKNDMNEPEKLKLQWITWSEKLCVCVVVVDSSLILIAEGKGGVAPPKRRLQRRKWKNVLLEMEWKHALE